MTVRCMCVLYVVAVVANKHVKSCQILLKKSSEISKFIHDRVVVEFVVIKMDMIIANVDHIQFKIERDLNEQFGALPLPFPGMDSEFLVMFT